MTVYSCRYQALAELLALCAGDPVPDDLPACDEPAAFATHVFVKRVGQEVEAFTRQCVGHDKACHALDGYITSIGLRSARGNAA